MYARVPVGVLPAQGRHLRQPRGRSHGTERRHRTVLNRFGGRHVHSVRQPDVVGVHDEQAGVGSVSQSHGQRLRPGGRNDCERERETEMHRDTVLGEWRCSADRVT